MNGKAIRGEINRYLKVPSQRGRSGVIKGNAGVGGVGTSLFFKCFIRV